MLVDQYSDAESGLYYYGARYYNPNIGRFISPDWVVQAPAHSQSLNRYSYAWNNPVNLIDPSGNTVSLLNPENTSSINLNNFGEGIVKNFGNSNTAEYLSSLIPQYYFSGSESGVEDVTLNDGFLASGLLGLGKAGLAFSLNQIAKFGLPSFGKLGTA